MKAGRVFWGVFFLILGVILLGDRLGFLPVLSVSWWRWWPFALVLIGVAVLLRNSRYRWIPLAIAGAFLGVVLASLVNFSWFGPPDDRGWEVQEQEFVVSSAPGIARAGLVFEGGAGTLRLRDTTEALLIAETRASFGEYTLEHDSLNDRHEVRLSLHSAQKGYHLGRMKNDVEIRLNADPAWDLSFDIGASKIDLDLEDFAVEHLRLDCGASKSIIRLGARLPETNVQINAGASSIRLEVPESAGCEVRVEAPLSSKGFPGFTKVRDGMYRTDNYDSATRRISVGIDAGVSSIRVARY